MIISKEIIGVASVIFGVLGYGRYFWDIYKRETRPHVFSWFVFGLISSIACFAQYSKGAGPGFWSNAFGALVYFSIAGLALFWGEKDIKKSDWVTFLGALAAIPLWLVTGDPVGSVILITCIDGLAYFPTFRKSWLKPYEETAFQYVMAACGSGLSLLALEQYSLTTVLYPLFLTVSDIAFVLLVVWRRRVLERSR